MPTAASLHGGYAIGSGSRLQACRSPVPARVAPPRPPAERCAAAAAGAGAGPGPAGRPPVLIVPGWLQDASHYAPLAVELRRRGYAASVAPLRWFNWIPTLGGRSVRPILDRLESALSRLQQLAASEDAELPLLLPEHGPYGLADFLREFQDPRCGARPTQPAPPPPAASIPRAAIVGHSAGGWISRVLLSSASYDGRVYGASPRVYALVTLGTPHMSADRITRRNLAFVSENCPPAASVRHTCVAGRSVMGTPSLLGGDLVFQSYVLCAGDGTLAGDGIVPLSCALGPGNHILVDAVHDPKEADSWYGSSTCVDAWVGALKPD